MRRTEDSQLQVRQWLTSWFADRLKIAAQRDDRSEEALWATDYLAAGWLTSMEVVEFVTEIEQHFEMQFSDHDLQDSRFVTIDGLASLILERAPQMTERC
jgi:acyl carrier protein